MAGIRVKNWDKWQSYRRDRGQPPWIKVHRCLMRNLEFVALTDAQRGQLLAMWLLAADHDGVIPASPRLIQKLCFMEQEPDLQVFEEYGFIEVDANVTPTRRQSDVPEESRGEENRKENRGEREERLSVDKSVDNSHKLMPPDYQPTKAVCDRLKISGCKIDPHAPAIIEKFMAHYQSNGQCSKNWDAAYIKWCLNEKPTKKAPGENRNDRLAKEFAHLDNNGAGSNSRNDPALIHRKED